MPLVQPSLAERARWAVALYDDSRPAGREAAYRRDRQAGIRHYKHAPAARLRADLEPVLRAYPDGTIQYSAACYVLARYGVDTERNAARLYDSGRMGRPDTGRDANDEDLPEALGDLWLVRRSPTALRLLLTMPSDGAVSEIQDDEILRVFRATPDAVLRAANRTRLGWSRLAASAGDGLASGKAVHEQALWARLKRDARR